MEYLIEEIKMSLLKLFGINKKDKSPFPEFKYWGIKKRKWFWSLSERKRREIIKVLRK